MVVAGMSNKGHLRSPLGCDLQEEESWSVLIWGINGPREGPLVCGVINYQLDSTTPPPLLSLHIPLSAPNKSSLCKNSVLGVQGQPPGMFLPPFPASSRP